MNTKQMTYYLFLRGINVGGHHKVPMTLLKEELESLGLTNVRILLNSGNVVFDSTSAHSTILQSEIQNHISGIFGFPIPSLVISKHEFAEIVDHNPFYQIVLNESTHMYITFIKNPPINHIEFPFVSDDKAFQIIKIHQKAVYSTLDLSSGKTIKGMGILEKIYGKEITT